MTSYVERNLHPGETVDYRARASWAAVLYTGVIQLFVSFGLFLVGNIAKLQDMKLQDILSSISRRTARPTAAPHLGWSVSVGEVVVWLALAVFIYAIVSLVRGWIFRETSEYAVTDQRVIGKYGLIDQQSVNVRIAAITGVSTSNTLLGRIFGYGTVWVDAAGASEQLVDMKDPKAFETAVYSRLNNTATAAYTPDARMAPTLQPQTAPGGATNSPACPRCGGEPGQGARFCPKCGYRVG